MAQTAPEATFFCMTLLTGRYGPNAGVKATSTTDEGPESHLIGLRILRHREKGKLYRPHCDLTGVMVSKENYPQMAELFRFAKYYNVPRYIDI